MRLLYLSVILLFVLSGCKKDIEFEVSNLNANVIGILGHAGMGYVSLGNGLPPNSFASVEKALSYGIGSEMDIQMSSDGHIVLFHDETLEGVTSCEGRVNDKTLDELIQCRFHTTSANVFRKHFVTPLKSVFDYAQTNQFSQILSLDVKLHPSKHNGTDDYYEDFARALSELIVSYQMENKVFVECYDYTFLNILQKVNPRLKLFYYTNFEEALEKAVTYDFYGITVHDDWITTQDVSRAHAKNARVMVFGFKSKKSLSQGGIKNPDFMQVDNVPNAVQLFK
jgi:glycerophosphoryl diester phosphodiesterase